MFLIRHQVAAFCKGRLPITDHQFLLDCGLHGAPKSSRVALGVRHVVGSLGHVAPEFIRAEDVFPDDLGVLPVWDSMDWLAFLLELEEELSTSIPEETLFQVLDLKRCSVREMVEAVLGVLEIERGK